MNTQPLAQQTFRPLDLIGFFYHLTQWASVHGLTFDDFSVSHGGSMLLMGLIDSTMDIDLTVNQELFDRFDNGDHRRVESAFNGRYYLQVGKRVALHTSEIPTLQLVQSLVKHPNGIWYRNEKQTLLDYQSLNRPQDKEKIKLLKRNDVDLIEYIQEVRKDYGNMSQEAFGFLIDMDPAVLSRIFNGKNPITAKTVNKVMQVDKNSNRVEKIKLELLKIQESKKSLKLDNKHPEHVYYAMYICEVVREHGLSKSEFGQMIGYSKEHFMNTLGGNKPVSKSFLAKVEAVASLSYIAFRQRLIKSDFKKRVKEFENSTLFYNLVDFFDYRNTNNS